MRYQRLKRFYMPALLAFAFMYYVWSLNPEVPKVPVQENEGRPLKNTASENPSKGLSAAPKSGYGDSGVTPKSSEFIISAVKSLYDVNPNVTALSNYDRSIMSDLGELDSKATSEMLSRYLQVPKEDEIKLKQAHADAVASLPSAVPPDTFHGRGIVMTGGGAYFPVLLAGLRWLRNMGSKIPVEVYMEDAREYEKDYCESLFPKIGVKCVVLNEVFGKELFKELNNKYVFKLLAILASNFDEIYFMDADSFPIFPIEEVWDSTPYQKTGFVLNADFWPRYVSPTFYEIAGIELGPRARGNPADDVLLQADRKGAVPELSTESGQLAVKKSEHIRSLLLATWYCIYGTQYWFPLIMQGGPGEGDKDTFTTAAVVLNESYYQTKRRPGNLGFMTPTQYKGFAMIQPHPQADWDHYVAGRPDNKTFLTLHSNSVKMNAKHLLQNSETLRGMAPLKGARFYGNIDRIEHETGRRDDIELRMFEAARDVACEWAFKQKLIPLDWTGEDVGRFCTELNNHVRWLRENPDDGHPPPGYD